MFHIKYPRFRGFFTWDELGCLARALGPDQYDYDFAVDLFQTHVNEEILVEENGLPYMELEKMLEYKLMFKALHLSQNAHTADWNTCVIHCCMSILDHHGLTYEDLYNARIAYQAYEAGDMKGMKIDQRVLLRTLKMCGKTIAPKKLMHRIKHSRNLYDEPNRMQLYEFLDLLLWAHGYEEYVPEKPYGHFEMEDELFKLVDFDKLLSHHDERLANRLNDQYLKDEWDFGKETLGDKSRKFKDAAVICGASREEMARNQKQSYQKIRSAVGTSQKTLYGAKSGGVRERPLTAPSTSLFQAAGSHHGTLSEAQSLVQEKLQRLMKQTDYRDDTGHVVVDTSDRPALDDYQRGEVPKYVTASDVEQQDLHWQDLMFQIATENSRHEIQLDTEIEHHLPGFREKQGDRVMEPASVVSFPKPGRKKAHAHQKSLEHQQDVATALNYPKSRLPPTHAKKCDARQSRMRLQTPSFRGWYGVRSKRGPHYVLMAPYFSESPNGLMFRKMAKTSEDQVKKLRGQYLYRFSRQKQLDMRPVTAPAVLTMAEYQITRGLHSKHSRLSSSGYCSMDEAQQDFDDATPRTLNYKADSEEMGDMIEAGIGEEEKDADTETGRSIISPGAEDELDKLLEMRDNGFEGVQITPSSDKVRVPIVNIEKENGKSSKDDAQNKNGRRRSTSAYTKRFEHLQNIPDSFFGSVESQPRSQSAMDDDRICPEVQAEAYPAPYMDHSKPRVVSVGRLGSMGRITLLENITEARYWEDASAKAGKQNVEKVGEREESVSSGIESGLDESIDDIKVACQKRNKKELKKSGEDGDIFSQMLKLEKKNSKKSSMSNASRSTMPSIKSAKSRRDGSPQSSLKTGKQTTKLITDDKSVTERGDAKTMNDDKENVGAKCVHINNELPRLGDKIFGLTEIDAETPHTGQLLSRNGLPSRGSTGFSSISKYDRLVKRMGDDISSKLANRLLSGS